MNEVKTKCMAFGKIKKIELYFNGNLIEQVVKYKYLGNVVNSIARLNQSVFNSNAEYLTDKARKAIYAMANRTKFVNPITPDMKLFMFDTLVKPILTYGSDVWGHHKSMLNQIDKVYLRFARSSLAVKGTTSNVITIGECGSFPPSVSCKVAILNYHNRVANMPDTLIAKQVYNELVNLHNIGFKNWVTDVYDILLFYRLKVTSDHHKFKLNSKKTVKEQYISTWYSELFNIMKNPILRTYNIFKHQFGQEKYLSVVKELKYRRAIAKVRCSSHSLAIETGRYTRPKTPLDGRLCIKCNVIEDEIHFVTSCELNHNERTKLVSNVTKLDPEFAHLSDIEKFTYLLTSQNRKILTWFGKFLYLSFKERNI